jgi:hypothetical protein
MVTLVLAASQAVAGASDTDESEWRKDSIVRNETIRTGDAVRVVNPFGNVYSRFGGYENEVEVLATHQRPESDRPDLRLLLSHDEDGLNIGVTAGDGASDGETRERFDLVVFVPQGAKLDVETRDGLIEVKKLRADVVASSLTGDLRITSIEGRVLAQTSRGRITATLETGVTRASQEFVTETGDVEVHVWEDADVHVDLATSGEICTDFSLDIEHRRFEEPNKHAVAIVGQGGPRLKLASKQGRVCLRRLQRDFRTED